MNSQRPHDIFNTLLNISLNLLKHCKLKNQMKLVMKMSKASLLISTEYIFNTFCEIKNPYEIINGNRI